jgi:hypothetical protein
MKDLGRFLFIVLIVDSCQGALVSSGRWEGLERPRSVSSSQKKCLTGEYLCNRYINIVLNLFSVFHMYSGLMLPLMRA